MVWKNANGEVKEYTSLRFQPINEGKFSLIRKKKSKGS